MRYRTIVADPPWEYDDGTGASYSTRGRRNCDLPYPTMTVDEIAWGNEALNHVDLEAAS